MKRTPPVKIAKWCEDMSQQTFSDGDKYWYVSRLIERARVLPVFDMPLACLNIYKLYPHIGSTREWVEHIKQVLDADLSCPIILDDEGYVMDGRHRIAKALLEGKESILAVRFDKTPDHDYIKPE